MACDKPTGDCTSASPCGSNSSGCSDCGCADDSGSGLPLPKCQNVSLTPGTFANATIVVNLDGCISSIYAGETPVYTPDDCCGGTSSGSGGTGARGPKGDPGPGSTVTVDPIIIEGTGTSWSVENIGTSSAAIFRFTAPLGNGDDCCPSGFTGTVCQFKVEDGLVKQMPPSIVTSIETTTTGTHANEIVFGAAENGTITDPCGITLTLNLDAFYSALKQYVDGEIVELQQKIDSNAYGVGINGNLAYNSSTSARTITVQDSAGNIIETLTVPAGGSIALPTTAGATYFVYSGTDLLGAYVDNTSPSPP